MRNVSLINEHLTKSGTVITQRNKNSNLKNVSLSPCLHNAMWSRLDFNTKINSVFVKLWLYYAAQWIFWKKCWQDYFSVNIMLETLLINLVNILYWRYQCFSVRDICFLPKIKTCKTIFSPLEATTLLHFLHSGSTWTSTHKLRTNQKRALSLNWIKILLDSHLWSQCLTVCIPTIYICDCSAVHTFSVSFTNYYFFLLLLLRMIKMAIKSS